MGLSAGFCMRDTQVSSWALKGPLSTTGCASIPLIPSAPHTKERPKAEGGKRRQFSQECSSPPASPALLPLHRGGSVLILQCCHYCNGVGRLVLEHRDCQEWLTRCLLRAPTVPSQPRAREMGDARWGEIPGRWCILREAHFNPLVTQS